MSSNDIKQVAAKSLRIGANTFDIQVYDECSKDRFVLDDEHVERLRERLPRTSISALYGDILLNGSLSGYYVRNRCDKEAMLNDSEFGSSSEWNSIDNDNITPEEVSLVHFQDNKSECFEMLLATPSEEHRIDVCSSHELDYLVSSFEPMSRVNEINLLSLNDEIVRNICLPATSFRSAGNEPHTVDNTPLQPQVVVRSIVDIINPISTVTNPEELLYTSWSTQNSVDSSLHLLDSIAQQIPSVQLSSSLQFVHDVHPYQKTQHDMDNSDRCSDNTLAPYVMRVQGMKTDADKGKSILPRIKLPTFYINLYQQQQQSLYLLIAAVHESKVNDKRFLYACKDMQFLPADTNKNTDAINPLQLSLYSLSTESDGTFKLSLRLLNNSSQSKTEEIKSKLFHELDDELATNLHPAPYDPRFFRLVCTLVKDKAILWDTLCFSDYIRPKPKLQT